jgi:hypothetical protein
MFEPETIAIVCGTGHVRERGTRSFQNKDAFLSVAGADTVAQVACVAAGNIERDKDALKPVAGCAAIAQARTFGFF